MFGYTQSGRCARYVCSKLLEQQQQQQAPSNNDQISNGSNFNDDR